MKQTTAKIFTILASVVLALVLCEAGLRGLGIGYPDVFDYDPLLGSKLRPGISGYFLKEGGGYVSINSDGLRDREHALPHPPNTLRIAVLGDSFAEAMQVNQDEAFWAVMERNLQSCPNLGGRRVEAINFGQAGFGTAQELLALRHRAGKYSPDIVLLAFFTGNDVADNSPALMQFDYNPYFTINNGKLVLHDERTRQRWEEEQQKKSWGGEFKRWRQDHFRTFQVLQQFQKTLKNRWSMVSGTGKAIAAQVIPEAGLSDSIFREPATAVWQEAWKVTEALLLQMQNEVAARGARFFVVVLSSGIQVHPDSAVRAGYARQLGVPDLFYPDRRVEQFCRQHGIPVLLLAPAFQAYATEHQVFLHGFRGNLGSGHWNQAGHRLAGEMLAKWLCQQFPFGKPRE
uniref:SGNH/GDSL hydrolase family protein n=1 Tax=Desulfobacca acetoxidans TaxID=60893 RepID=A0A7C3Z2Q0_9BACT